MPKSDRPLPVTGVVGTGACARSHVQVVFSVHTALRQLESTQTSPAEQSVLTVHALLQPTNVIGVGDTVTVGVGVFVA